MAAYSLQCRGNHIALSWDGRFLDGFGPIFHLAAGANLRILPLIVAMGGRGFSRFLDPPPFCIWPSASPAWGRKGTKERVSHVHRCTLTTLVRRFEE